jgi:hypothetical protein
MSSPSDAPPAPGPRGRPGRAAAATAAAAAAVAEGLLEGKDGPGAGGGSRAGRSQREPGASAGRPSWRTGDGDRRRAGCAGCGGRRHGLRLLLRRPGRLPGERSRRPLRSWPLPDWSRCLPARLCRRSRLLLRRRPPPPPPPLRPLDRALLRLRDRERLRLPDPLRVVLLLRDRLRLLRDLRALRALHGGRLLGSAPSSLSGDVAAGRGAARAASGGAGGALVMAAGGGSWGGRAAARAAWAGCSAVAAAAAWA